jgi:Histidine kinase-, DNA gyrase B-, and HSP90-like ATPase
MKGGSSPSTPSRPAPTRGRGVGQSGFVLSDTTSHGSEPTAPASAVWWRCVTAEVFRLLGSRDTGLALGANRGATDKRSTNMSTSTADLVLEDTSEGGAEGINVEGAGLNWGLNTPRGGKAVMNRILKDGAKVPLFFGQTLIQSLRDIGYNHTTSALCEHVDNAIQADAKEVRIFFRQTGKRGSYRIDAAVYDDGHGMSSSVLKMATAFGGSLSYGNRQGIARFGMGMKTAALSMSPVMELFSWQEPGAYYNMTLDVEAIGRERANLVELPDPLLLTDLPGEVADFFRKPLDFPKDRDEQILLAPDGEDLKEVLPNSGTIVYMPECDRLTYAKASTLVDHAVKEMARIYRRAIGAGMRLYVNNRIVEAFDPTYSMTNARHVRLLDVQPKHSKLIVSKSLPIRLHEHSTETAPITIKLFRLPIEEWTALGRKMLRNDLRVFDGHIVSILRNDRELFAGGMPRITTRHSVTNWWRLQIDFGGILDEAFGVASNKQGVRLKGYVEEAIKDAFRGEIAHLNEDIKRFQAQQAATRKPAQPSTSETKASETDAFQPKELQPISLEDQAQLEANLRGLALTVKRDGETDEEAFTRVKISKYILVTHHDKYWPFYDVRHNFGRVILTINTAHPFFTQLYEPVRNRWEMQVTDDDGESSTTVAEGQLPDAQEHGPIVALELLLLSLARTQGRLASTSDEAGKLLDEMRREWSDAYRIQLS